MLENVPTGHGRWYDKKNGGRLLGSSPETCLNPEAERAETKLLAGSLLLLYTTIFCDFNSWGYLNGKKLRFYLIGRFLVFSNTCFESKLRA